MHVLNVSLIRGVELFHLVVELSFVEVIFKKLVQLLHRYVVFWEAVALAKVAAI